MPPAHTPQYQDESDLAIVKSLVDPELSEPYTIFTYRYFLHTWPSLCFLAFDGSRAIGTVVCKLDVRRAHYRGYIAMLVVEKPYRGMGVGRSRALGWLATDSRVVYSFKMGMSFTWQNRTLPASAWTAPILVVPRFWR